MGNGTEADGMLQSIPAYLRRNSKKLRDAPAFREKEFGVWQTWSWSEVEKSTTEIALGLMQLGVNEGDYIAVIGRNRPALYWAMMAAQMTGAIPVPIYQDSVAEEMSYVLGHCGARFVIADDQEQVDKVIEIQEDLPALDQMVYLEPRGLRKYDHSKLSSLADVQSSGASASAEARAELEKRIEALNFESVCVLLYTSGTTGKPKGVVLSNRNIIVSSINSSAVSYTHLTLPTKA